MAFFDYSTEAVLSPAENKVALRPTRSRKMRQPIGYGRFARAADAILRIPTMTTTRSDGWRPPVPIDDDHGGAEDEGAVRCIF
jgi:hypothetical protein